VIHGCLTAVCHAHVLILFIYGLFNDAVRMTGWITSSNRMTGK
jgi:hypothetical protein